MRAVVRASFERMLLTWLLTAFADQCRGCVEVRHTPIEAMKRDPAGALGTLSRLHAQATTTRFSTVAFGGAGSRMHTQDVCFDAMPRVHRTILLSKCSLSRWRLTVRELPFPGA
jgi:hypothetical protein